MANTRRSEKPAQKLRWVSNLIGATSINEVVFLKNVEERNSILVETPDEEVFFISHEHLLEMEESITYEERGDQQILIANWRKAGSRSEFLRCDKQSQNLKKASEYLWRFRVVVQ